MKSIESNYEESDLEIVASELQKHVLPYEWLMLPTAVKMSVKKIID